MKWEAEEHEHRERSADWFWGIGLGALAIAIISILLGNLLFALFVIISAFALVLQSIKKPHIISYELGEKGVTVGKTHYHYSALESFWVIEGHSHDILLLKSERMFMPLIVVPLGMVSKEDARDFLLDFLPEEEQAIPLSERIMEFLGF